MKMNKFNYFLFSFIILQSTTSKAGDDLSLKDLFDTYLEAYDSTYSSQSPIQIHTLEIANFAEYFFEDRGQHALETADYLEFKEVVLSAMSEQAETSGIKTPRPHVQQFALEWTRLKSPVWSLTVMKAIHTFLRSDYGPWFAPWLSRKFNVAFIDSRQATAGKSLNFRQVVTLYRYLYPNIIDLGNVLGRSILPYQPYWFSYPEWNKQIDAVRRVVDPKGKSEGYIPKSSNTHKLYISIDHYYNTGEVHRPCRQVFEG